jgi:hypothetical protein
VFPEAGRRPQANANDMDVQSCPRSGLMILTGIGDLESVRPQPFQHSPDHLRVTSLPSPHKPHHIRQIITESKASELSGDGLPDETSQDRRQQHLRHNEPNDKLLTLASKWRGIIGVMWRLGVRRVSHDPRLRGMRGLPHGPASS